MKPYMMFGIMHAILAPLVIYLRWSVYFNAFRITLIVWFVLGLLFIKMSEGK